MFLVMSTASNPDWPNLHWQFWRSTSSVGVRPWGFHWRRCNHKVSCYYCCAVVFCCIMTNQECAACTTTSHLTELDICRYCQQRGLMPLSLRWHVHATSWSVTVSSQCHCLPGIFGQEVWPRHPIALGPSLVACSRACQVQLMCVGLMVSAWHSTVLPCRWSPADFCCWHPSSPPVRRSSNSGGQVYQTLDAQWPCIFYGSHTYLEQPPIICQGCAIISVLLEPLEDMAF